MTEVVISIAAKAAEYLVKPIIQQGKYLFCANMIIQNLVEKKEQLSTKIEEIQKRIQEDKEATKLIEESAEKWVIEAKNILEAAENLKQEMEANKNCFQGWCPPWRRYRMLKQMAKKTEQMREQISREIKTSSHIMPVSDINFDCSEGFTYFPSTVEGYKEILEALQDDKTKIIGLYGMAGCGKTALVKEVKKNAKKQLFDVIILVTMSRTPNINAIQGEMARELGLQLGEVNEDDRAARLWQSLEEQNRVLIIVDDVWEMFNLKHIGIDFDKNHKGSRKVLLTTRYRDVCALMDCQRKIMLRFLSDDEAWSLFQKCASIDDHSPEMLLKLAREVSERCKGLPIAIKVMGTTLKAKRREFQVDHLQEALETLKKGEGDVFRCLRFSYDCLPTEQAKQILLMCAMFPEDHEIYIEDLIRYGVGLGICGEFKLFDSARRKIRIGLSVLLDSCLLMYSEEKMHVKMHDLIRVIALSISSERHQKIMVNHEKDLDSLAGDKGVEQCFAISSWYYKTDQISCQLVAPKLEILMVNTMGSLDLSYASFEFMKRLKVLAIIDNRYYAGTSLSLPQSIQSLTNLKTLRLIGCRLGDISFILSLEGLEVLDLQNCIFNEVPDKIEKLRNLKLLNLRSTSVKNYNSKAIGRCSQLEEFYVSTFGSHGPTYSYPNPCFVHDVNPTSLLRYELVLGGTMSTDLPDDDSIMRFLGLTDFDVSTMDRSKENLLQKAKFVSFVSLSGGFKNICPDINQAVGCMNELNRLDLSPCSEIECLLDTTSNHAGSFQGGALLPCTLINLRLEEMENLKEVCHGEPPLALFKKLEELHIHRCEQLHSIFPQQCNLVNLKILRITICSVIVLFSMSIAKNMQQLEVLTIEGCPELSHVITTEVEDGANTREEISLAPNNCHFLFPNLKELSISKCPKLQVIFSISCVQQNEIQIMLPCLQVFELHDLENLLGIFPQNYNSTWPSVSELSWKNCPKLTTPWIGLELRKQHLNKEAVPNEDHREPLTSKLEILTLIDLPELRLIWFGPNATQILSFQYLQCLEIVGFKEMKFIFSMAALRSLSELTSLEIGDCEELVEIIAENEESKNFAPVEVFFPKLSMLEINRCNKLKSLFSIATIRALPQLTSLKIGTCEELVEIIAENEESKNFAPAEMFFPKLSKLKVEQCNKLKSLFSIATIRALPQLTSLKIGTCEELVEIIAENEESKNFAPVEVFFPKLSMLEINRCNKLKNLFSIATIRALPQLTSLIIFTCEELVEIIAENEESKNFAPVEVFFPKLSMLEINRCNKLKSLFSIATIRALPQLSTLHVSEAAQLKEIFGQSSEEDIVNEVEIVVSNLTKIRLEKLQNFVNVYQGFMLHKLKLQEIVIDGCPKFTPILGATQVIPLHRRTEEKLILWPIPLTMDQLSRQQMHPAVLKSFLSIDHINLRNCGVEGILQLKLVEEELGGQHKYLNSNLDGLYLSELPELRFIWSGPTQFLGFDKLTYISVEGCPKLKTIFPPGIVGSLKNLRQLTICNCEELEEISDLQVECFPKLSEVEVEKCNKLKCIFYADCMASRSHASPRGLFVRHCSQLERIYGLKHPADADNKDHGEREVLLDLFELVLESLPNFTEIGQGIKLKKRASHRYMVKDCPKYIQQFPVPNTDDDDYNDVAGSGQL